MSRKVTGGRHSFLVITLVLILCFGNACIAIEHGVVGDSMILRKKDTGRQITIKAGDIIRIELEAIGGTG